MRNGKTVVYPYIPNSVPETRDAMLREIGAKGPDDLYVEIPERLRYRKPLNLPDPFLSELDLKRHVEGILARNKTCEEYLSFLGAGCYQHYVPAVVDEVIGRAEFLTAYGGETYSDLGKYYAIFEYASLMTELLGMDVIGVPTFDWGAAASTSVRTAARATGRPEVLVVETVAPDRLSHMRNFCSYEATKLGLVKTHPKSGLLDLDDLGAKLTPDTACVYIENPSYLGFLETQVQPIADMVHANESLLVVGVNPISLGVLAPPGHYGADIVCGDGQPLGVHLNAGGGQTGFVSVRNVDDHIAELPCLLISLAETEDGTAFGFCQARGERTSYAAREYAKEFTGTSTGLWAMANVVYLALMGPQGMRELGETILQKAAYARKVVGAVPGVRLPYAEAPHFDEFVVSFDAAGRTVAEVNRALLDRRIFGGKDLSREFPALGPSALYCVTEIHTRADIDRLAAALKEVLV